MNIPPHTAVVSAVPPVGHPTYFSQFYNPKPRVVVPCNCNTDPRSLQPFSFE